MAARGGRRIDLSALADEPPLADARVPSLAAPHSSSARIEQVAANPRNRRDPEVQRDKLDELTDSIRDNGQLQPSTVVTRDAFLRVFPEHEADIGDAIFVQVTGWRRRLALLKLGLPTIDIVVKNKLAESRASFIAATTAENIDREDYDPVEEAGAVQDLVAELGSGKAAAEKLHRTPAWVTQRLNLLKLEPELHAALRASEIPLREVRDLHKRPRAEQLEALATWRNLAQRREQDDDQRRRKYEGEGSDNNATEPGEKPARPRRTPIASALLRLGGTPVKIAETLRASMPPEDRRALAEELLKD